MEILIQLPIQPSQYQTPKILYISSRLEVKKNIEHACYRIDISDDDDETKKDEEKEEDTGAIVELPNGKFATKLDPFFIQDLPDDSNFAAIGSTIYCLGGSESVLERGWPEEFNHHKEVYSLDTTGPGLGWVKHPSTMLAARICPGTAVVDGKLYVMGGYERGRNEKLWGEVFDPNSGEWEPLPPPPFHPLENFSYPPRMFPVHVRKEILLQRFHAKDLCSFDVVTKRWQIIDSNFENFLRLPYLTYNGVATDDETLYLCPRYLHAYDLKKKVWYKGDLQGWNDERTFVQILDVYYDGANYYDHDPEMFHLDGNHFYLLEDIPLEEVDHCRIKCSKFRVVSKESNGFLNAFVESTKYYLIDGGGYERALLV